MTVEQWHFGLTFAAAMGSGVIGGVFYAFSTFVMKALGRRPAGEGMGAMQGINVAVINPMFLGVFLGTVIVCGGTVVTSLMRWGPGSAYVLAGSALYVLGTFGVTMVFNVPLNNALAGVSADDSEGQRRWADYSKRWTAWNHVRTAAAVAAMGALVLGLCR